MNIGLPQSSSSGTARRTPSGKDRLQIESKRLRPTNHQLQLIDCTHRGESEQCASPCRRHSSRLPCKHNMDCWKTACTFPVLTWFGLAQPTAPPQPRRRPGSNTVNPSGSLPGLSATDMQAPVGATPVEPPPAKPALGANCTTAQTTLERHWVPRPGTSGRLPT